MAKKKFNFKGISKNLGGDVTKVALIGAGMIGSHKFLSFDEVLKNQPADSMIRQNEGLIKLGLGLVAAPMVKNQMIKDLLTGMSLDGFIKAVRKFTTNKETDVAFMTPIGKVNGQPADVDMMLKSAVSGRYMRNSDKQGVQVGVSGVDWDDSDF